MKVANQQEVQTPKLLLLGAGESGKSTIFKQLRMIYSSGYSPEECASFKMTVFNNAVLQMQVLINQANARKHAFNSDNVTAAHSVLALTSKSEVNTQVASWIKALWADPGIQATYAERNHFQLNDSAPYFFTSIDRIATPDYTPSNEDIIRTRVPTTGVVETSFTVNDVKFRLFDVGGQRNERKKWIHCFDNVTAVLFVAALSEYDQVLYEDETQNRMEEALQLFEEICNNKYFTQTSMILFLNKRDLFQEKLQVSPLSKYFSDFTGGTNYDLACQFITDLFLERKSDTNKGVYVHITCATDKQNIQFVFKAIQDIILSGNLGSAGFL
eukprot:TRINITY_DN177_c0_g1_i2.p1 TRINITY_DN177_c0_g1~~TRINITY_DN177_c0_g1_i2.p1  ORF type:complete len:369 (+),score=102.13 TRINITY_DN177_c0_g1_i2:125-1108(+)